MRRKWCLDSLSKGLLIVSLTVINFNCISKNLCGNFRKSVKENTDNFVREEFIVEDNVAILRKIVKDKRNMPVKLKDGQMKVDLYTASAFVQTLDKITNPSTKKKLEFIINKGNKAQFLRTVDVIFK